MPRSFFEILLEKKNKLYFKSESEYLLVLDAIESSYLNLLRDVKAISDTSALGADELLKPIINKIKGTLEILRKYQKDKEKYRWNDPSVQEKVEQARNDLAKEKDNKEGIINDINQARMELLGEDGSLRKANAYFETAESLRVKGGKIIFEVASLTDKEIQSKKRRENTDITEVTNFDVDLADIVAKKGDEPATTATKKEKDDYEKTKKERENLADKRKKGIIKLLAGLLGDTEDDIEKKWNDKDPEKGKKYRIEILQKSVPYMESITGKKYKNVDSNPFADKEFMLDISALGTYTPGYDDYIPPKSEEDEKITDKDKEVIQKFMVGEDGKGGKKKEVLDILDKLEKDNQGSGPKEQAIRDEISKAKTDLEGVEAKNACDFKERTSLRQAKEDMESKISANKSVLTKKDEEYFNEIIKKIEEIDNYCSQKSYRSTSEETKK